MSEFADVNIDLSEYDEDFAELPDVVLEEEGDLPDGKYDAMIQKAEVRLSQHTGDPMVTWKFQVIKGKEKGKTIWKNQKILTEPKKAMKLKEALVISGVPQNFKMSNLQEELKKTVSSCIGIDVVTFDGSETPFVFIKRRKKMEGKPDPSSSTGDSRTGSDDDDDVPF